MTLKQSFSAVYHVLHSRPIVHEDAASRLPQFPYWKNESEFTSTQPFSFEISGAGMPA